MAEAIGLASGLVALSTFALQSGILLRKTIESYDNFDKTVSDLKDETEALIGVLDALADLVKAGGSAIDLSALDLPLLRVGTVCEEYSSAIDRCSSRSKGGRKSFRDWAKLTYMGDNIDGFRRSIADYKATIMLALMAANLRTSSLTAEDVKSYQALAETTKNDLERRLESFDEKLEVILRRSTTGTDADLQDLRAIREERKSTRKCLQICAQLSQHISEIRITPDGIGRSAGNSDQGTASEALTNEALQDCKNKLTATSRKLEGHMTDLVERLVKRSAGEGMEETTEDLKRLKDEWDATVQGLDICSAVGLHLRDTVSTIDNYAVGDAVQFMVSNSDKTIRGTNRGLGWRTKQLGGHASDETIQQVSRDFAGMKSHGVEAESSTDAAMPNAGLRENVDPKFRDRYGPGVQLFARSTDRNA